MRALQSVLMLGFLMAPVMALAKPAASPPAAALSPDQLKLASSDDLSIGNREFDQDGTGPLQWLVPDAPAKTELTSGWLTVRARDPMAGWYSDGSGPFLYLPISGDFVVETRVTASKQEAADQVPVGKFSSTGLLIRDPASANEKMRWVMYNIGFQDKFFGTEAKTTRDFDGKFHFHNMGGFRSLSTLYLTKRDASSPEAYLRMCRVGPEIRMYFRRGADGSWTEEAQDATTQVQGNGASNPTPGVTANGPVRFLRPDLPPLVQVGLIANRGGSSDAKADGESRFDFVKFKRVSTFDDCTA